MKRITQLLAAISLCIGMNVVPSFSPARMNAQEAFPEFADIPNHHFLVSQTPAFRLPKRTLRRYIETYKKQNQINHFCIVGYHFPENPRLNSPESYDAYGFWQEKNQLFLYQASGDAAEDPEDEGWKFAIHTSWDWNHDTRDDDTNLGIHAVTKAWWTSVVRDCWKHGEFYTIQPLAKSKPKPARP